jgi:hypothetical protein
MSDIVRKTAYEPTTGKLLWVSFGPEGIILFPEDQGFSWVDGEWSSETHYVFNGEPTTRPTTGLPETYSIAASTDWILSDIPEGTEVEVDGVVLGTTDATGLTLSFDAPGTWPATLRPPFPWISASCEVTVT